MYEKFNFCLLSNEVSFRFIFTDKLEDSKVVTYKLTFTFNVFCYRTMALAVGETALLRQFINNRFTMFRVNKLAPHLKSSYQHRRATLAVTVKRFYTFSCRLALCPLKRSHIHRTQFAYKHFPRLWTIQSTSYVLTRVLACFLKMYKLVTSSFQRVDKISRPRLRWAFTSMSLYCNKHYATSHLRYLSCSKI